jgi:glycerol-3-phosphate dehydrogenase
MTDLKRLLPPTCPQNEAGQVIGAKVRDLESGDIINVYARTTIAAAGPFTDALRRLADTSAAAIIRPSAGAHITLPDYYCSSASGMIVPKTKDGRVVFMLPWMGKVIAGTTDVDSEATARPRASEEEVTFILDAISDFLKIKVQRSDVLSVWSGIRPLAADPNTDSSASTSRDHGGWGDALASALGLLAQAAAWQSGAAIGCVHC